MLDFLKIELRRAKNKEDRFDVYPNFVICNSQDLMIKGGDFYAIWSDTQQRWSTDEQDAVHIIDNEIKAYMSEHNYTWEAGYHPLYMWDSSSGVIDRWHKYCQKQMRDNFTTLDNSLTFANTPVNKNNYASKRLSYALSDGEHSSWDRLLSVLYSTEERHKIEWCIGAIVSGESKDIQKFAVLYGSAGTGKSTILNIIQKLFDGYCSIFDAKALGSSSNQFALEAFKNNPIVAIQHDGDLSRIEDNTRINSIVSHEEMTVNEKYKSAYSNRFNCFLFMGTNKPVRITDAKSGLIRRLIDISPTGEKLDPAEYRTLIHKIDFELGAIAYHCKQVYTDSPDYYNSYVPTSMLSASNDFYNFVLDSYSVFEKDNSTSLKAAWAMYKSYSDEARVAYPMAQRAFKEELKNYFKNYFDRYTLDNGARIRSYYTDFLISKFENDINNVSDSSKSASTIPEWLTLKEQRSSFDELCSDMPAQYASVNETPVSKWDNVTKKLRDLDTNKLHYVKVPQNHIVIDFDIRDQSGNKSIDRNLEAASKWPATYAEVSKSGQGIHLHYIYDGDPTKLSRIYDANIEIKVYTGNGSLRRQLTACNDLSVVNISSGLPLKEDCGVVKPEVIKSERALRILIKRNLNKEIHPGTKPSVEFIKKILDDAYASGLHYDVTDMSSRILSFAMSSTHWADKCVDMVSDMKWKSDEPAEWEDSGNGKLVFYDTEVYPNLFVIVWKYAGEDMPLNKLINPTPTEVSAFINQKTNKIDFNGLKYDRQILWARMLGYSIHDLFVLSQKLIGDKTSRLPFTEAKNIGYTDIFDFASAANKMSLKKLEIKMGIHHQEMGIPWDQDVPEELWESVVDYCCNDVIATEKAFYYLKADWMARQILADLADGTPNDTTNALTTKIIFGNNRHPQNEFNWRDLSKPVLSLDKETEDFLKQACPEMMAERHGPAQSILPYFPGYEYKYGKSYYKDSVIGEGGRVTAQPGMYFDVALLDIASQHPHSAIAECIFGCRFTQRFREIVEGRVSIKHKAWDEINQMLDGKLTKYIEKVKQGEITASDLANALKTAINSVYGLTAAKFDNPFKDPRNIDNIVAKRGALFMTDLEEAVRNQGFEVAHIKTDSIKIPNATPEIIEFVMTMGKRYGYTFEHEATYERMCLVNDAVYIAKFADADQCQKKYGYAPKDNQEKGGTWTATGKQFQVPYVFKTLFSKEPIIFDDMCETVTTKTAPLYLDTNEKLPDVTFEEKRLEKAVREYKTMVKKSCPINELENKMTEINQLKELTNKGHDYHFVGRVGRFTPVLPGSNGGWLVRQNDDDILGYKYNSASGAKGYRWVESETIEHAGLENSIDISFYRKLVDDAVNAVSEYGDFDTFVDSGVTPWSSADDQDCPFDVR